MPGYRYVATDAQGKPASGVLEAADREAAASLLGAIGLRVERLEQAGSGFAAAPLSEVAAADFAQHVARVTEAGLPLPEGLRALGSELATGSLRSALGQVADALETGRPLDAAIAAQGRRFPPFLAPLVHAGQRSGHLADALEQYARYHHLGAALKRRVLLSLLYPLMLMLALVALFVFLARGVVAQFEPIFTDFGIDLPGLSVFLIAMSHVVSAVSLRGLLIGIGLLLIVWVGALGVWGRGGARGLFARVPMVGPLLRWLGLVELTHMLALLLESETPLPVALGLASQSVEDPYLGWVCRFLRQEVSAGRSLSEALGPVRGLPTGLGRILGWAERHQSLPQALHLAGEMYEARARAQAAFLGIACTVMAIVLVIWGVGLTVLGMFLPLIQLISKLSG